MDCDLTPGVKALMLIDRNFGPYFPEYDWYPMPAYLLRRRLVLSYLQNFDRGEILDIGCGMAALLHELSLKKFSCTGFDISKETLGIAEICQKDLKRKIKFFTSEQTDWTQKFDHIFAFEVLEHIVDDDITLNEWLKWLKPGGTIYISVPNHVKNWNALDEVAGHVRRYNLKDMHEVCEKVGLKVELITAYGFPLNNLCSLVRNILYRRKSHKKSAISEVKNPISIRDENNLRSARIAHYPSLFRFMRTRIGLGIIKLFYFLQDRTQKYNLGNGIIVKAKKID